MIQIKGEIKQTKCDKCGEDITNKAKRHKPKPENIARFLCVKCDNEEKERFMK